MISFDCLTIYMMFALASPSKRPPLKATRPSNHDEVQTLLGPNPPTLY